MRKTILISMITAVFASILTLHFIAPSMESDGVVATERKETAFDRVQRTRTLRCGYNYWEPVVMMNEEEKRLTGIFPDFMEAFEDFTGIIVEWTAIVDWGNMPTDLNTGKVDAICAGVWNEGKAGLNLAYTNPVFYNAIEAYVHADEDRLSGDLTALNRETVTVAIIDASAANTIADLDYPKAQTYSIPSLQSDADLLMAVANKKADVTFTGSGPGYSFMQANPGKIKPLNPQKPVRILGSGFGVGRHEYALQDYLNTVIDNLVDSGIVDRILDGYEVDYPQTFRRVAKPYKTDN